MESIARIQKLSDLIDPAYLVMSGAALHFAFTNLPPPDPFTFTVRWFVAIVFGVWWIYRSWNIGREAIVVLRTKALLNRPRSELARGPQPFYRLLLILIVCGYLWLTNYGGAHSAS